MLLHCLLNRTWILPILCLIYSVSVSVCVYACLCLCACVCVCSVLRSVLFPFIYVILDTGRVAAARDIEMSLYYNPLLLLTPPFCHPLCVLCFGCLKKWWDCGNFLCHSVISIFKYSPSFVYAARKLFEAFFFIQRYFEEALRLHPNGNLLDGLSRCAKSRCELRWCWCQGRSPPPFAPPPHPLN